MNMRRGTLSALCFAAAVLAIGPGTAEAQVDGYHLTGINFNFANPGARARGIGGAFVALADDSTAALANPAGLAFLDGQFSLEVIYDEEQAPVGQATQGQVDINGAFPDYAFTAVDDPYRVSSDSQSTRISHASLVFPIPRAHLGLAVYYASLADLDQDYSVGPGLMCVDNGSPYTPGAGGGCTGPADESFGELYTPFDVRAKLTSDLIGVGVGWALGDALSIGGSVAWGSTEFSGRSMSRGIEDAAGIPLVAPLGQTSDVDDSDVMYSLGVLYRGDLLGIGLNYRSEMTFDITSDVLDAAGDPIPGQAFDGEFRIPERFSAGLALFPGDNWVVAGEYVRIPYSTIPEGMPEQFDIERQQAGVEYTSADVNEYHVGAEYTTFSDGRGWSVRIGYWRDQSHLIYASQGYNDPIEEPYLDRLLAGAALLYQELDVNFDHFTAGVGAAFGRFRLDAAVDYSEDAGTDFLLSGVFYF